MPPPLWLASLVGASDYISTVPGYMPPEGTLPFYTVKFGNFIYSKERGLERIFTDVDEGDFSRVLEKPKVLRVDALHSCWAHALLDQFVFWIQASKEFNGEPFIMWFRGRHFIYPSNIPMLDSKQESYKPSGFKDLCDILGPSELFFEHKLRDGEVLMKDAMVVTADAEESGAWALWDDASIYAGRPPRMERIPESVRYLLYSEMSQYVLEKLDLVDVSPDGSEAAGGKQVTIVSRKGGKPDRKFNPAQLQSVRAAVESAGFEVPGLTFWEDMTLQQQVERMRKSHYLVARHGAGERK